MPASIRDFADNAVDPKVRGYLHLPATPNNDGLVLTHGAGSNAQAPLLIALAETFCRRRIYRPALRSPLPPIPLLRPARPRRRRPRPRRIEECPGRDEQVLRAPVPGRPLLRRTPVQHARRRGSRRWLPRSCCSPTRCIPRASPSSSAPSISPTCARPLCS